MFQSAQRSRSLNLAPRTILWMALGLLAIAPLPASSQTTDGRKMKREIRMMENILDDVMVDSRNVLVGSQHSVNGVYLPGYGAVFSVEAGLLLHDRRFGNFWSWSNRHDDDNWLVRRIHDDDDDDDDADRDARKKRSRRSEEDLYARAKEEMSEALIDYGDTLEGLAATDWVALCVYLDDTVHIGDKRLTRLTIRIKASDLRDVAAKKLSRDAAMSKLIIDEY